MKTNAEIGGYQQPMNYDGLANESCPNKNRPREPKGQAKLLLQPPKMFVY